MPVRKRYGGSGAERRGDMFDFDYDRLASALPRTLTHYPIYVWPFLIRPLRFNSFSIFVKPHVIIRNYILAPKMDVKT